MIKSAFVLLAGVALAILPATAQAAPAYSVVDKIAGPDGGWDYASFDAATGKLYVAHGTAVLAVDVATRAAVNLAPANGAHQAMAIDGGKTVVETDGKTGTTRFIDAATGVVQTEVATGVKPDAAFYDRATARVVVMSPGNDTVTQIDAVTHKVVNSFKLAGGLEFAVPDGKGRAFVNLEDGNAIAEIDLKAGKLLRKIALPGCTGPTGLALVGNGTRLISACANGVAMVVDAVSGRVVGHLDTGKGADAVLVDEQRGMAFIPCGGSGTLVAISIGDARHIAVVGTIPTQISARTGALDPRDGRIYLPVATFAAPEPGAKRGKQTPGSFMVLVVAPQA